MTIGVPRWLIVGLAALFSAYHVVLAVYSLSGRYIYFTGPIVVAIVLYAIVIVIVLVPGRGAQMPVWMAALSLAVAIVLPLLVTAVLVPDYPGGYQYGTWYVAAVGTLMTIVSTRRRPGFAWVGIGFLAAQTLLWAGPAALPGIGVIGSAAWVGVSHILTNTLSKAVRDSQRFALAEREATEWQAAQEAHLNERQFRLSQTSVMALPMLRAIQQTHGELTPAQRAECLHLEGAIRDEIRGRKLLNDAVREQVMLARRRGTTVTLLDEGGIDDIPATDLDRILNRLALALRDTTADKVIARTVPEGSDVAVTVVGLRTSDDGSASLLGHDPLEEDEVELWLEIPRTLELSAEATSGR
jgi:hypothetical protein